MTLTKITAPTTYIVTVPDVLWKTFEIALRGNGLRLVSVPVGPHQQPRFTLRWRTQSPGGIQPGQQLSAREFQVLAGISLGQSNHVIAQELQLGEDTIKSHARRLFQKLGARSRAHAVAIGYQRGLLTVDGPR